MDELASPIGPEVGVDDGFTWPQGSRHADDRWPDELVVLATRVASFDRLQRRCRALPHPVHDRVVAGLRAVPALVAIHREVAPADRRDSGIRVDGRQLRLERGHERERRSRRRVAAIEQGLEAYPRDAVPSRELRQGHDVPIVGVHSARPDEPDDR
jgi:hypothetical protein